MKIDRRASGRLAALAAIALLAACAAETKTGSNGTGILPSTQTSFVTSGTLLGADPFSAGTTTLETATTVFRRDDLATMAGGALQLGMSFSALGTQGSAGATAVLQEANTQSAAAGPIDAVDGAGQRFRIATLTFVVDANTLYEGVAGFAALAPGVNVEVSGLPLADARTVLATRVARIATPLDGNVLVMGRIEAVSAQGLTVAGLTVPVPNPAVPPAVGTRARVSGLLDITRVAFSQGRAVILADYFPGATTRVEMEGIALDAAPAGGAFRLRTPARDYDVAASMTTVAVAAGSRVRVIGTATSPASIAPESLVRIEPGALSYRVTGAVSGFESLAALRVRGEPVDLTTAVIRGGAASEIANGRRLMVVGVAGPGALRVSEATLLQ